MSENVSEDTPENPFEDPAFTPRRLGAASAVVHVAGFALASDQLFSSPLFSLALALAMGLAALLYLPYTILMTIPARELSPATLDGWSARRGAAGYALGAGGTLAFAVRFLVESTAIPLAAGAVLAAAAFLLLAPRLPDPGEDDWT